MFQKLKTHSVKISAVPALVLLAAANAHAALPEGVSTAVEAYKTDSLAALGLIMGAGVAIWGLQRLARRFGWT